MDLGPAPLRPVLRELQERAATGWGHCGFT